MNRDAMIARLVVWALEVRGTITSKQSEALWSEAGKLALMIPGLTDEDLRDESVSPLYAKGRAEGFDLVRKMIREKLESCTGSWDGNRRNALDALLTEFEAQS